MSSSEPDAEGAPGGASPAARVLARALDKVIKHSSWRRHAALVAASKSALDLLSSAPASGPDELSAAPVSPVPGLPAPAADAALAALLLALDPGSPKVAEPALECVAGLLTLRLLRGDVDAADPSASSPPSPVSRLFAAVLSCVSLGGGGDDALELAVLRVLVAFARCPTVSVSGECLGQVVKACYNVYLGSASGGNQLCAKLAIAQALAIVFARVEADDMDVRVRTVSAADMMDLSDRSLNDSSVVQAAQAFINEAMEGSDVPEEAPRVDVAPIEGEGGGEDGGMSKIREDGLALFKNICKLSMKFGTPDSPDDPMLLRGKILSLELVRMVVDNAGPFWKTNEKYVPSSILLHTISVLSYYCNES
jgi:brefeldin A-inhibited guanine nucleotide-exchange protein